MINSRLFRFSGWGSHRHRMEGNQGKPGKCRKEPPPEGGNPVAVRPPSQPNCLRADRPGFSGPDGSRPILTAHNIGVRRGERWIIRHVNFSIKPKELVHLVGANGAGKSTCMKAILGLIDINEGGVERKPSLEVGYVPQRLAISPTMPLSMRRMVRLTGDFTDDAVDNALATVKLERLGDPPVTTLSGGELQRLLLARALIHKPDLLILDEPAQGIDVAGAEMLHQLIEDIRVQFSCGILMSSHDARMALEGGSDVDLVMLVPYEHDHSNLANAG